MAITILGRISPKTLKKLKRENYSSKSKLRWCFIDYSPEEIKLGDEIITVEFEFKNIKFAAKLLLILDQFNNALDSLPKGWQTMCLLNFENEVPKLSLIDCWKNKN